MDARLEFRQSEVEGSKPSKARQLPAITATSESMLYRLRAPSRPHRQVPHLRQNARHLHPVQLGQTRHNLGDELIFHQLTYFLLPVPFSAGEQIRHADLERSCQSLQRR